MGPPTKVAFDGSGSPTKAAQAFATKNNLWPSLSGSFEVSKKVPIQELPELFKTVQKEEKILKDEGRILLRYSGTESKVRLLVEATSEKLVHSSFHNIKLAIQNSLSST